MPGAPDSAGASAPDGVLAGEVVIVTGASSGLGENFARVLHAAGAYVALAGRRQDRLDELAAQLPSALAVRTDVTVDGDLERLVARTRAEFGGVTGLVNSAGSAAGGGKRAEEESIDDIRATLAVNVVATFRLCQLVLPDMRERHRGSIVNIGSIAGLVGIGRVPQASYAASKGAVHALTRELAAQWGRHGIRVNTLAPGLFQSEMTRAIYDTPRLNEWIQASMLLPRLSEPVDYGAALVFLLSDASRNMTGQELVIDGGWTAH
jgi:NAD(P)-dependent dehydrogenase (short-subunit alcohol dehydrogenase family)